MKSITEMLRAAADDSFVLDDKLGVQNVDTMAKKPKLTGSKTAQNRELKKKIAARNGIMSNTKFTGAPPAAKGEKSPGDAYADAVIQALLTIKETPEA
tara:strand:+ start:108 stop:401 length:294 start_codon:yes stop_codon:yes gene_type:complete